MKFRYKLLAIVIGLLGLLYGILFTAAGNAVLKPLIEMKVQEQTHLESQLKQFSLTTHSIDILLDLNTNNTILIKGTYSLWSQSFSIEYALNLKKLNTLEALTKTKLNGSFVTSGTITGDMDAFGIIGKSDVAKSSTDYSVEVKDLNPTSIIAHVKELNLDSLLYMLNQKKYASANVNLDVNFKSIVAHHLDGTIKLETLGGMLNSKVLKKDFNITVPHTKFSMNLDALLQNDNVKYKYLLNSNLMKLTSSGVVAPTPLQVDLKYALDIQKLELLKPLTGADLRGTLSLNGDVKGSKKLMNVTLYSDVAASTTTVNAQLKEFQASSVKANIKGLKLQKLLYMMNQPHYADALFDMNVNITNANVKNLSGAIESKIYDGEVDSKYMTKAYSFESPMPKTNFLATTQTTLQGSNIVSTVDFSSTLADINITKALYNVKASSFNSDYKIKVHDLAALYFVTQRELKGEFIANGELSKAKELDFSMHSNIAGGAVDAKLHNDDFHADIKALQTLDILDMLVYPKIFKSNINAKLDYNIAASKGEFTGVLSDGTFTKNQVLDLTKRYAKFNMYKENFKGDVKAKINKENIVASLDLISNSSSIKTAKTLLNTKSKKIYSTININANGNPLVVKLKGDVNSPKVTVDASKLIQKEATKAVKKELDKVLNKDASKAINKLFKGLF
ncbi:hypothetical protein [Sulfurimonas sp.]